MSSRYRYTMYGKDPDTSKNFVQRITKTLHEEIKARVEMGESLDDVVVDIYRRLKAQKKSRK